MSTQYSTSLRLWEGQQNDPAIAGNWGTPNSANFTWLDSAIAGTASVNIAGQTTYSLTTANGAPDQSRELVQDYIGALSATCTVTLPNVPKIGWARNDTTGGHTVIESAGAGTNVTLAADGYWYFRATDGSSNVSRPNVAFGGVKVGGPLAVTGAVTLSSTLSVTGGLTGPLVGTSTNDNAPAGDVGQFISAVIPLASAFPIGTGGVINVTAITLTAGDWDVRGEVWFSSTQGLSGAAAGITNVSGTFATDPLVGFARNQLGVGQVGTVALPLATTRVSVAGSTLIYLLAFATFGTGTANAYGKIEARRAR